MALIRIAQIAAGAIALLVALSVPVTAQDKPAAAPIIDKPFADHHLALQLSDSDPKKEALVLSVAYNLLKYYGPDRIAIEVVTFGPGIDFVCAGNAHRAEVDSLISQGVQSDVCMNRSRPSSARPAIKSISIRARSRSWPSWSRISRSLRRDSRSCGPEPAGATKERQMKRLVSVFAVVLALVEFAKVVGVLAALRNVARRDCVAFMLIGVRRVRVVDVMVVVDREQDLAVDPVGIGLEELTRRPRQPGELFGRVAAVEALDEAPDLGALPDALGGEHADAVDRALVEIGFDEKHLSGGQNRRRDEPEYRNSAAAGCQDGGGTERHFAVDGRTAASHTPARMSAKPAIWKTARCSPSRVLPRTAV